MTGSTGLVGSLQRAWQQVVGMIPDLGLALVLLFAGWVVARVARRAAIRALRWLRVDQMAERAGLEDFLIQGGIRYTTVSLIGHAVYWLILLSVFIALLDALGVPAAGGLLARLAGYVPNLVLAVGILVFGSLMARVAGAVVATYLNNIGSGAAESMGALTRIALLAFVLFTAAEQLAIESRVLVSAFQIAFGALCFALAIAFGLGGRDWAASVIDRYTRK